MRPVCFRHGQVIGTTLFVASFPFSIAGCRLRVVNETELMTREGLRARPVFFRADSLRWNGASLRRRNVRHLDR